MSRGPGIVEEVSRHVGAVPDPELGRTLRELDMVRRVTVSRRGHARIEVALTTAGCPMAERIRADVEAAARTVAGVVEASVEFSTMSEAQREQIGTRVVTGSYSSAPAREIYAVASGKGGVGKSSLSANLAVSLAAQGRRVGLIDADVWGYSVPQLFGVDRAPVVLNGRMLPVEAFGVRLMSLGFFVRDNAPVVWRGPMLHKALTQFVHDTHWGDLDVLLLDLPPGTGDVTLSVLELLPEASLVAVTTPQPAAQVVASRVGAMARDVHMPVSGVVENMSELVCAHCGEGTAVFGSGGGARLAAQLDTSLLGQVPLDVAMRDAGDRGTPVVVAHPHSAAAAAITTIAGSLRPARRGLVGRSLGLTPVPR